MKEKKYQKKFLVRHPGLALIAITAMLAIGSWIYIKGYEPEGFLLRSLWPLLPYILIFGWIMLIIRTYVLITNPKKFKKEVIKVYRERED